jgi:hypothetical protein
VPRAFNSTATSAVYRNIACATVLHVPKNRQQRLNSMRLAIKPNFTVRAAFFRPKSIVRLSDGEMSE